MTRNFMWQRELFQSMARLLILQKLDLVCAVLNSDQMKDLEIGLEILETNNRDKANHPIAQTYKTIADIFSDQGLFGLAEEYYANAMSNYLLLDDTLAVGWLYVDMGNLYFENSYP